MKRPAPNANREPRMTTTPEVCPSSVVKIDCTGLQQIAPVCTKVEKDRLSICSYLQLTAPICTKIKMVTALRHTSAQISPFRHAAKMANYDHCGPKVYFSDNGLAPIYWTINLTIAP